MSKIINDDQKFEIENLADKGHFEALVAYGADMYHDGIVKGEVIGILVSIAGIMIYKLIRGKVLNK